MLSTAQRARARADANAVGGDEVASAFLSAGSGLEAVLCDIERELQDLADPKAPRVGLALLQSTLAGVASAQAAGDLIALRGELVNLAAQSAEWARRLPGSLRRPGATGRA